jgi:glucose/arabinose dehydrogenase
LIENKVLIEGIPGGPFHDGGRIQFGPDGKLYVTTGEAGNPALSQDLNSLGGKILRINSDGTIPEDNPWEFLPIYSIGHRNPQGIDWDDAGNLVATEHGPSGLRGIGHDEINLIVPGTNYGWPDIIGDEEMNGMQSPLLHSGDDAWAPSGSEFYDGYKIPHWTGNYFVATLRGNHLHMIEFNSEITSVVSHEKLFQDEFGRIRDVQTGPDGFLYLLTSNQDGRGSPKTNDDKILRIVPIDSPVGIQSTLDHGIENFQESGNSTYVLYVYIGLAFITIPVIIFVVKKRRR